MNEPDIRCTVVDERGTVSFVGPGHIIKVLTAACAQGATDTRTLLDGAQQFDPALIARVLAGLSVFDEYNVAGDYRNIQRRLSDRTDVATPFRVVDDATRRASLEPVGAGIVVFNLKERRIVQIQNSYAEVRRQDRGRVREAGQPTSRLFRYKLPAEWAILP